MDKKATSKSDSILDGLDIHRYGDWLTFTKRLEGLIAVGHLRKVTPLRAEPPNSGREWYVEQGNGDVYIYTPPDGDKGLPEWEKFDPFARPEPERPSRNVLELDLRDIPVGQMGRPQAVSLLTRLWILIGFGKVEAVDRPLPASPGEPAESWYRDLHTGIVYKLVEGDGENDSLWEPVPQHELHARIQ